MSTSLNDVSQLVNALVDAEGDVEKAEARLKAAKEVVRMFKEESIPTAMQELGLKTVILETGETVTITQEVYPAIPADRKAEAYSWLEDNGFGGLLKLSMSLEYGKGEKEKAVELYNELAERGLAPELSEGVHAQTLKAFIKEQITKGSPVPADLFGGMPVFVAKIKAVKKSS